MPTHIAPLAGVRYSSRVVPDLGTIMTPPYDVISNAERVAYMGQSPYSMIHLILGAEHADDTANNNRFTRAAGLLREWRRTGVLVQERQPALYIYQQEFSLDGVALRRTGFIGRVRLADYQEGIIFPHEQTFAGPKADLLRLWRACRANLSQVFAVYCDATYALEAVLAPVLAQPPQCAVQHWQEGVHRLWLVTDPQVFAQVQQVMHDKPLVIADGHHRYETALALRNELRQQHPAAQTTAAYDYVMMYCANIYDPGMCVLSTHRLLQHMPVPHLEALLHQLAWVQTEVQRRAAHESLLQWQHRLETLLHERQGPSSTFAVYAGGDCCYILTVPRAATAQRVQFPSASAAWKQLDVSILHYALLPALQAMLPEMHPDITYARAGDAVLHTVACGDADLAVLLPPTPLDQMVTIAMGGERMPHKSTYFYPKLPTGLVINCFDA